MKKNLYDLSKINFKYVTVRKKCVTEEVKISYNNLIAIVDMSRDYVTILQDRLKEFDENDAYLKALFNLKIEQIKNISQMLATSLQYYPEEILEKRKNKRRKKLIEETGLDPLESLALKR